MDDKERFISIMKKITIGCTILYTNGYDGGWKFKGIVEKINPCSGTHEGCKYCIGSLKITGSVFDCFKHVDSYKCKIVEVISNDFLSEEEMEI